MSLNTDDPYEAAAWWLMQLCCGACGQSLDLAAPDPQRPDSDDYWHEYGQRAKQRGWQVRELSASPPTWAVRCPACTPLPNQALQPTAGAAMRVLDGGVDCALAAAELGGVRPER